MKEQTLQEMLEEYLRHALDVAGDKVVHDRERPNDYAVNTFRDSVLLELFDGDLNGEPFLEFSVNMGNGLPVFRYIYVEDKDWIELEKRSVFGALQGMTSQKAGSFFVKLIDELLRKDTGSL